MVQNCKEITNDINGVKANKPTVANHVKNISANVFKIPSGELNDKEGKLNKKRVKTNKNAQISKNNKSNDQIKQLPFAQFMEKAKQDNKTNKTVQEKIALKKKKIRDTERLEEQKYMKVTNGFPFLKDPLH